MSHQFTSLMPAAQANQTAAVTRITHAQCQAINDSLATNDERGNCSLFTAFWPQFAVHSSLDSEEQADGTVINRYDGLENGQGIYPRRRDALILNRDGTFRLTDGGLPQFTSTDTAGKPIEIVNDAHRGNENRFLKAMHLMACKLHNKRMAVHGNYDLARDETVALLNQITLEQILLITGFTSEQLFNVTIPNFHLTLEFVMAVARWGHAQMPDTVQDEPIFTAGLSTSVSIALLFEESARKLDFGVSQAMREMNHVRAPHNILERTSSRHFKHNLATFSQLATRQGRAADHYSLNQLHETIKPIGENMTAKLGAGCPIFHGILAEADLHNRSRRVTDNMAHDQLGPVGARAVADGFAGALAWGRDIGKGLWFPLWHDAPKTSADIVTYALSE